MKVRMNMPMVSVVLAAVVVGGGVALTGTSPASAATASSRSMMDRDGSMMEASGSAATSGTFSRDVPFDLQFIDQMTMHHQGALMSTQAMIADSSRLELRDLAAAIEKSQSAQITQMQQWRTQWYGDAPAPAGDMGGDMMGGDMMGGDMMGPASMGTGMSQMMGGASNVETMYLQMMVVHHQMGVDMANEAVTRSARPEIRQLAQQIADEQSAQIVLMRGYLAGR